MDKLTLEEIKDIREHICKDTTFWAIGAFQNKDIAQIKSHVPFFLYDRKRNQTLVILDIYKEQYIKDDKASPEIVKVEYLDWKEWIEMEYGLGSWDMDYPDCPVKHYGWFKKVKTFDNFKLDNLCGGFLPTEKQFQAVIIEKIYGLPEERVLLTSRIEAHTRIDEHCKKIYALWERRKREREINRACDYDSYGLDEIYGDCLPNT